MERIASHVLLFVYESHVVLFSLCSFKYVVLDKKVFRFK